MGNVLKMDKQQQIRALLDLGWSYRRIEKETGVRRETISKYDHRKQKSKAAKVPTDELPIFSRSSAAEFHETIIRALEQGLSSQRIYQDLVTDHQAQISYDAVKRYVRKQKQESPKLVAESARLPVKKPR
jgi:IS30 family transposase